MSDNPAEGPVSLQDELLGWITSDDPAAIAGIDAALSRGATFSGEGIEPLFYAAFGRKHAVMAHLLARGATLAAEWPNNRFVDDDLHGRTALHAAAENDDAPMLRLLLASDGRAFLGKFDEVGRTPLMAAVDRGHESTVDLLIKAGSDVNAHDEAQAGETAIIWAVESGQLGIVRRLLDAGADPTIPGWMGLTAIHRAQRGGNRTRPSLDMIREWLNLPGDQWERLLIPG